MSGQGERWTMRFPHDGDVLRASDGELAEEGLRIVVQVEAAASGDMDAVSCFVNGVQAVLQGDCYVAPVALTSGRNELSIQDQANAVNKRIVVYWLPQTEHKYRLSFDDTIWWLQDIAEHQHTYKSIFDNPYLAMLRDVHQQYGTKMHFNLYAETDGFDLSQMPDTYKPEWQANADWMRMSFHAWQNDPPRPYEDASSAVVLRDYAWVTEQIERFAGPELLETGTTIHWGAMRRDGCRALRQKGIRAFAGYFRLANDKPLVSYYLDAKEVTLRASRDIWLDTVEELWMVKIAAVLDNIRLPDVVPALETFKRERNGGFLDLMIHEQYYYPHYTAYQPDYRDKLMTASKWAHDNGYAPAFLSELGLWQTNP